MNFILFALGFIFLIRGADYLVEGASNIARKLKISSIVIGLTIVSFGTSLPELIVNINASIAGNAGIAIGNVIGSNIANILLVLGVTSLFYPLAVKKNTTYFEIPFSLLITILLLVFVNLHFISDGFYHGLSRFAGIILILLQIAFMIYVFKLPKSEELEEPDDEGKSMNDNLRLLLSKAARATGTTRMMRKARILFYKNPSIRSVILVITGIFLLAFGGRWTVNGAAGFADDIGVSQELIGYTIVAIGTCLPELITSIVAALKKNADIAVGNVVGSLIFNILWVLGVSAVIAPIPFLSDVNNNIDLIILIGATVLFFLFVGVNSKYVISRGEGVIFVLLYAAYIVFLVMRG